jgi:hypothetical protein
MTRDVTFERAVACRGQALQRLGPPRAADPQPMAVLAGGWPGGWPGGWAEAWARAPLDARPASAGTGAHAAFLDFVRGAVEGFRRETLAGEAAPSVRNAERRRRAA